MSFGITRNYLHISGCKRHRRETRKVAGGQGNKGARGQGGKGARGDNIPPVLFLTQEYMFGYRVEVWAGIAQSV